MPIYQFNSFSNRLGESNHLQPLYPLSTNPLSKSEPPKMIYDSIKTKPARISPPVASAQMSTLHPKMLKKYKFYQKNLETPVYLIRGTPDKILFGITCAGVAAGVVYGMGVLYSMAFKK